MTNNLEQRFKRHLSKNGSYYTKYSPPLKIVYSEECSNKYDAAAWEKQIKGWTKAKKLALIARDYALLKRL